MLSTSFIVHLYIVVSYFYLVTVASGDVGHVISRAVWMYPIQFSRSHVRSFPSLVCCIEYQKINRPLPIW